MPSADSPTESKSEQISGADSKDQTRAPSSRRLTFTLRSQEIETLQELAERSELKLSEVVRRAISRDDFIEEQLEAGRRILIEDEDGTTHIVEFVS